MERLLQIAFWNFYEKILFGKKKKKSERQLMMALNKVSFPFEIRGLAEIKRTKSKAGHTGPAPYTPLTRSNVGWCPFFFFFILPRDPHGANP